MVIRNAQTPTGRPVQPGSRKGKPRSRASAAPNKLEKPLSTSRGMAKGLLKIFGGIPRKKRWSQTTVAEPLSSRYSSCCAHHSHSSAVPRTANSKHRAKTRSTGKQLAPPMEPNGPLAVGSRAGRQTHGRARLSHRGRLGNSGTSRMSRRFIPGRWLNLSPPAAAPTCNPPGSGGRGPSLPAIRDQMISPANRKPPGATGAAVCFVTDGIRPVFYRRLLACSTRRVPAELTEAWPLMRLHPVCDSRMGFILWSLEDKRVHVFAAVNLNKLPCVVTVRIQGRLHVIQGKVFVERMHCVFPLH
jgi:hypothetical protein